MKVIAGSAIALALLGAGCAPDAPAVEEAEAPIAFESIEAWKLDVRDLTDAYVDKLIGTLDGLLASIDTAADMEKASGLHLWRFENRLRTGILSPEQVARVLTHLDELSAKYPAAASGFERTAFLVENLRLGAVAPDIVGKDAYGEAMSLADYRGKVVVLVFSGQWCGPCRSEYPYQRLLTEVYANRPFAIFGVNSDSLAVAKTYMAENNLDYRSVWDGPTTEGPIATRWHVTGWPTLYVLDHEGRIRFVDARHEVTLKAVAQLLEEIPREPAPAPAAPADST